MTGALSVHYAQALADAVFKPGSGIDAKDAVAQLRSTEALISGSKDLQLVLLSPAVNKQRKIALFSKFSDQLGLHRTVRNFLSVLISHRRTHELKAMLESFEEEVDQRLGLVRAQIVSARELTSEQREEVERGLGTKLGKFIRAEYSIDPALLGGIRAHVGARVYDATLRGKLESMRQYLHASS